MPQISRRELLKSGAMLAFAPAVLGAISSQAEGADPYADGVLVDGEPAGIQPGSFTIAVLPDTQNYSEKYPATYLAQTNWIVENQASRNIACVLHLGDITNHNSPEEWKNAVAAMSVLDGKVPYFLIPGNHDYSAKGACKDRTTLLNEYFPVKQFRDGATFGGTYDKEPECLENSYHLLTANGRKFLILALEFGPRRDVVRWADEVVSRYHDREAILITHAYMYFNDTRYDWKKLGKTQAWNPHAYAIAAATEDDVMDGEEIWTHLISRHENFIMTLNGHVLQDGLGKLTSSTPAKRDVHQMLVNFQMRPNGGDGWLRLLEFRADGTTVDVVDFSPTRKQCNRSAQNAFELTLSRPVVG